MQLIRRLIMLPLIAMSLVVQAQTKEEIDCLNLYVEFLNESVHGLFTAHALLVINNKEVNKYIDLDSYSLNTITNKEVQSNLFEKSDKANYTTFQGYSPMQLHKLAKENSSVLKPILAKRLNETADEIVTILNRINQLRFEIAEFIEIHDLNQKESIYGVFELLEEVELMFEQFAKKQRSMVDMMGTAHRSNNSELYVKALNIHRINKAVLLKLRDETTSTVGSASNNFKKAVLEFDIALSNYNGYNRYEYESYIKQRLDSIAGHVDKYEQSSHVPKAYQIYGKNYYYHNQIAKRFFNWSGPGYVRYMNGVLSELDVDFVNFTEEPLIFKVVYPMKLDELNNLEGDELFLAQQKYNINAPKFSAPSIDRPVEELETPANNKYVLAIKVFDHHMLDRDTISLYLNGECILDKYNLQSGTKELELEVERNQDYTLEIKAENEGVISPNTASVGYRFKGQRKRRIIESHLNKGGSAKINLDQTRIFNF